MKYKTETVIEAIRLKEAGVTTSAISKELLAPTSTINEWLKKAKQNNLTAENLRTLSEQDIEEILRPRFSPQTYVPRRAVRERAPEEPDKIRLRLLSISAKRN